jgi:ABC-type lipopolysaccharide export system ATPase subunit
MTPEQRERYLARCKEIQEMTKHGYTNPELEKMMLEPSWKDFYKQHLTQGERKQINSYLELMKNPSFGCLDTQIKGWEALVERIQQIQKKLSKSKK